MAKLVLLLLAFASVAAGALDWRNVGVLRKRSNGKKDGIIPSDGSRRIAKRVTEPRDMDAQFGIDTATPPSITSFTLIDADTNTPIDTIEDGDTINMAKVGTNLNMAAIVFGQPASVQFELNSMLLPPENIPPFSLFGDNTGQFHDGTFPAGPNTVTATPYLGPSATGGVGVPLTISFNVVFDPAVGPSVTSFTLINTDMNQPIGSISNGDTINLNQVGTALSVRANVDGAPGSVQFELNSLLLPPQNAAPFSLFGDNNGYYTAGSFPVGQNTLTATPYTGSRLSGDEGTSLTATFTVVSGTSTPPTMPPTSPPSMPDDPTQSPTSPARTQAPTPTPRPAPTKAPTDEPRPPPTKAPTERPRPSPTKAPTERPRPAPTKAPIPVMTMAPTKGPPTVPTPLPLNGRLAVISLTLIDADTDVQFGKISNGDTINLAFVGTALNIRADVVGMPGSVQFQLNSMLLPPENFPPFALFGDTDGNFSKGTLPVGPNIVTATPYTGSSATGDLGTPLTIQFNVAYEPPVAPSVTSFSLIDTDTNQPIGTISDGDTLNLAEVGTKLNLRANVEGGPRSVQFQLNSSLLRTENFAPFALFGDNNGYYQDGTFPVGETTVTATPYTGRKATGSAGTSLTVSFKVVNVAPTPKPTPGRTPGPTMSLFPSPAPSDSPAPTDMSDRCKFALLVGTSTGPSATREEKRYMRSSLDMIRDSIRTYWGFRLIDVYLESGATKHNVIKGLDNLLTRARNASPKEHTDCYAFIHLIGHGHVGNATTAPDRHPNATEEGGTEGESSSDEAFVPYDHNMTTNAGYLWDDEFVYYLKEISKELMKFDESNLIVQTDFCYAGGMYDGLRDDNETMSNMNLAWSADEGRLCQTYLSDGYPRGAVSWFASRFSNGLADGESVEAAHAKATARNPRFPDSLPGYLDGDPGHETFP